MFEREELIQKIVQEKGLEAIPNLINLIDDEDPETRELVRDVLSIYGHEAKDYLLDEFKTRFELNKEDDIVLLYISELLSDLECREIINYLERMLNKYNDERAFPLIIENLFKLTKDKKYLDILETFIEEEGGDLEEIGIMAITHVPSKKVIDILLKKYYNTSDKSVRVLILDSILKIILKDLDLSQYLKEKDIDISQQLQWHLNNSLKNKN